MDIRSFLAFELPGELRTTLEQVVREVRGNDLPLRWVKPQNIHLTMIFLGNIKPEVLEPIQEAAKEACGEFGPFRVAIQGIGTFPNRKSPRVLWLGLDGDMERLSRFRDALQQRLIPFGIQEEKRPFRPHLTLGRFRKVKGRGGDLDRVLTSFGAVQSPLSVMPELVLFRSDLRPQGAIYTRLGAWPLSGTE